MNLPTIEQIVRCYFDERLSLNATARKLGCSTMFVSDSLKENGHKLRTSKEGLGIYLERQRRENGSGRIPSSI